MLRSARTWSLIVDVHMPHEDSLHKSYEMYPQRNNTTYFGTKNETHIEYGL